MEKIKKKTIEFLSRSGMPVLLASIIAFLVVQCYFYEQRWLYTFLFAAASVVLFLFFDRLRKHKFLGTVIYLAALGGVGFLASRLMRWGWSNSSVTFTDWFYLNRDTAGFNIYYFMLVYLFGGFFLVSIIYYFTRIRFRSLGLMLCLLFPFVIYAKRADNMTSFQVTLIITVFLAIIVHERQNHISAKIKPVRDISYLVSVALFVSFAGALAMIFPKPEVKSVLEKDSHAFDITPLNNSSGNYSTYSRVSSARYGASYTNQIMFYAESDYLTDAYYLKRQSYDTFYDDIWHNDNISEKYTDYSYYSTVNIDRKTFYEQLAGLAATGKYTSYGLDPKLFDLPEMKAYSFRVYDEDFKASYVPAPLAVIAKRFDDALEDPYYLYGDGEISVKNVDRDYDYTVSYYPQTPEYVYYASELGMTGEQYYSMLIEAVDNGDLTDSSLLDQYIKAYQNYTGNVEYTDRMYDLAREITKDCTSDFQKANALCNYFSGNGFLYDLSYTPPDESIDYFLFEGKTGVCTSYATAMAIMARLVGLPARYVEGFAAYETQDDGTLVIRDAHAHAYVEVFIPGAGWLDFDPTIADYAADYSQAGTGALAWLWDYLDRSLVFIFVVLFVIIVIMYDRILELVFRIRQHFVKGDERIVRLYARTVKLLGKAGGESLEAYTPAMICKYAVLNNYADVQPIASLFERTCFGGIPLEDAEYDRVYKHYKENYKLLRKRPKPKKVKAVTQA